MNKVRTFLSLLAALALGIAPLAPIPVFAAATTQTLHQYLCSPIASATAQAGRRVVNSSSTASPQPSYVLNSAGCAVIANADAGFFLAQGFYYGPNEFVLQQMAVTANQVAGTSTLNLPAYGYVKAIVIEETAGNAVTGGVDCGNASSATAYASAVAVGANATVISWVPVAAGTSGIFSNSGVPAANQILCIAHTGFNSASLNISVIYGYY